MRVDPSKLHSIGRTNVESIGRSDLGAVRPADGLDASRSAQAADQLILSHRAEEVRAARAALAQAPEVRAERVAELKAQIASGSYRVDAETVAKRILNTGA